MKLYGYILLFLIVIMIFTSSTNKVENFGIFGEIDKALNFIPHAVNAIDKAGDFALKSGSAASAGVATAKPSFASAQTALAEAKNAINAGKIIKTRIGTCHDMAKTMLKPSLSSSTTTPSSIPGNGSTAKQNNDPKKCRTFKDKLYDLTPDWFKRTHQNVKSTSSVVTNFKKTYQSHLPTPECKAASAALQKRLDADDPNDRVTAEETQLHANNCGTCLDHASLMLLMPANEYKIDQIVKTTEQQGSLFDTAVNDSLKAAAAGIDLGNAIRDL